MKGFEAKDLERLFKDVGRIRKGKREFSNDSTYWEGGRCNWGGSHNLSEDCQTIASSFAKIDSLKEAKDVLKDCLSEQDFNTKKQNFIRKCNESASGLRPRTGYASSMFGICIIWAEHSNNAMVEKEMELGRQEIANAKRIIEQTSYNWAEELKRVQFEINQIEARIEENRKKAAKETDPVSKAKILAEIEKDGELLKAKFEERNRYTDRFKHIDPSKYVSKLIERIKQAIEGRGGGSGNIRGPGGSGGNRRTPANPNDPFGDPNNWPEPEPSTIPKRTSRSNSDQPQNNQQLILIVAVVGIVIFFMMQKDKPVSRGSDYYDY